ncbi:hypothetical protein BYT27DRAFT_6509255 [Phlegmacium glaucopus]|nr:hypothetical protein BYT27DRAFT_6509255 [Phlegmacium glaucopus]
MGRRLGSMVFMIFAPEMITCWAIRQWLGARVIANQFRAYGWTKTHGFFIQMGGFMLYDGDQQLGILSADKLQNLLDSNAIDFPTITEEEIQDRSKGDFIAKGLVVLQTSWFITQCFARLAQHLVVTEIEIVTMAFAVLNGILYFFWWNKPVDIQCSVPVFLKTSEKGFSEKISDPIEPVPIPSDGGGTPWTAGIIHSASEDHKSYAAQVSLLHDNPEPCTGSISPENIRGVQATAPIVSRSPSLRDPVNIHGVQATVPTASRHPSLCDDVRVHTTPVIPSDQKSTHILPKDPSGGLSRQVSQVSIAFTHRPGQESSWLWRTITFLHLTPFAAMAGISMSGSTSIPNHSERVHTFYARSLDPATKELLSVGGGFIAAIFGAIHCIAWHFPFPTHIEQNIWRASSLVAAIAPNAFTLFPMLVEIESSTMQEDYDWRIAGILRTLVMVCFLGTLIYFPARLYLLVEACLSLRSLSPRALENVKWTSFIPHLG